MVKRGIILAGHGSTMAFNKSVLDMQADLLRSKTSEDIRIGFNETSTPLIKDVIHDMATDGYNEILILPFFVALGLHIMNDIPVKHLGLPLDSNGGEIKIDGRSIRIYIDKPIGDDPKLTDIIVERVEELRTQNDGTYILIMGHGSRLDYNSKVVELNASRLRKRGYKNVYVGYNEFNDPKIEDEVLVMMSKGAKEIIAIPLFISLGKHLIVDIPQKLGINHLNGSGIIHHNGQDAVIRYANPIGGDPRLCEVLLNRIRKYW